MQRNVIVQIKLIKLFYCTSNSQLKKGNFSQRKKRREKMHYCEAASRSLLKYEEQKMHE